MLFPLIPSSDFFFSFLHFNEVSISFSRVIIVITEGGRRPHWTASEDLCKKGGGLGGGVAGGLHGFPLLFFLFFLQAGWCHCQLTNRQYGGSAALQNKDRKICGGSKWSHVIALWDGGGGEDDFI